MALAGSRRRGLWFAQCKLGWQIWSGDGAREEAEIEVQAVMFVYASVIKGGRWVWRHGGFN